jgi:hypothetical protein
MSFMNSYEEFQGGDLLRQASVGKLTQRLTLSLRGCRPKVTPFSIYNMAD